MCLTELSLSTNISTSTDTKDIHQGDLLNFEGVDGKDVYNITAPFIFEDKPCIAGRVESRKSEKDFKTVFFEKRCESWRPIPNIQTFDLQDPFVTKVDGEFIFGGTQTFLLPNNDTGYRINIFRGKSLRALEQFTSGPDMMKGIRILELPDKSIFVATRPIAPWVDGAGPGRIGFITVPGLCDLTPENILKAKIIPGLFKENEWGGVNELQLFENGLVGVLGHRSYIDCGPDGQLLKHYQAITFKINPITLETSSVKVIATRKDFPIGPSKRSPELDDVYYPGGLLFIPNKLMTVYGGLGDTQPGSKTREDSFYD
jgi:hypothetical protein